jgi:eukaryotic-like serine/threonine-protein kinase
MTEPQKAEPESGSTAFAWAEARSLFEGALDREGAERARWLSERCGANVELLREVEELLAHAGAALEPVMSVSLGRILNEARRAERDAAHLMPGASGARIGAYRLVRRVGSGGMGSVFEAEQDNPRRRVALKLLHSAFGRVAARRFTEEAQVLARLRHPNITQVYEAGVAAALVPGEEGQPWFAMEFVESARSLTDFAREERLSTRAKVELLCVVCAAVEYGHQRGVIHRDLKPGNILVDRDGRPRVIDFGIARVVDEDASATLTRTGDVVGTLNYMSPEQIGGDTAELDTRTDVYALGVVLYELLAGALPYDLSGKSITASIETVREVVPDRPSSRVGRAEIDAGLDAITLKALAKEPDRRYASARALSDDLRRWLSDLAVEARVPSRAYRLRVLVRRHKLLVTSLMTIFVLLALSALVAGALAWRATRAEQRARFAEDAAVRERDAARFGEYVSNIGAAEASLRAYDVLAARARLASCPAELRGFEWRHLWARTDRSLWSTRAHPRGWTRVAFSPRGDVLASTGLDGRLCKWSLGGELLAEWPLGPATILSFHPSGRLVALAFANHAVRIFDLETGRVLLEHCGQRRAVDGLAFSPDGKLLVSASTQMIAALEVPTGNVAWSRPSTFARGSLRGPLAFDVHGATLACASTTGFVVLLDPASGALRADFKAHTRPITSLAFDPRGERLVSGSDDLSTSIWDAPSGTPLFAVSGTNVVWRALFTPDARRIVSTSWQPTVQLWNPDSGGERRVLLGHTAEISDLALSPDGSLVASTDFDGTLKLWRAANDELETIAVDGRWNWNLALGPGSDELYATHSGDATLYDVETARRVRTFETLDGSWVALAASPDGGSMVVGSDTGTIAAFQHDGQLLWRRERILAPTCRALAWTSDGAWIAALGHDGRLAWLSPRDGARAARPIALGALGTCLALAPKDHELAVGLDSGQIFVLASELDTAPLALCGPGPAVVALAWNPKQRELAVGRDDGSVERWDLATRTRTPMLASHTKAVRGVVYLAGGKRLATASDDRSLMLWDLERASAVVSLQGHAAPVLCLCTSRDGSALFSGGNDETLRVWRAPEPGLTAAHR